MRETKNTTTRRCLAGLGMALAFAACSRADGDEVASTDTPDAASGARIVNVQVTPVVVTDFVEYVRVTGEIEALHDVTIAAEESGAITEIYVDKGARIGKGTPIMKIDDELLRAGADEARALMDLANEQFERQRQLWEDEGIGSEITYLQAKSSATAARARLRTLETRLARTVVRAPVDGVFDEHFVDIGEMASPGSPVARVVSVGRLKVVAGVPERYALFVQQGDSARITLDAFPSQSFGGIISFVGASVDGGSRTVRVEIALRNPDRMLKPRMVANVEAEIEHLRNVIVVPQDLVVRTETGHQIFLAAETDGRAVAQARAVRLGRSYSNRVVVESGLAEGDAVITLGHRLVDHGSRIRVVDTEGRLR